MKKIAVIAINAMRVLFTGVAAAGGLSIWAGVLMREDTLSRSGAVSMAS
ncbi:hypothetical protein [Marilutibacter alkalisoli]|nr:hypothetical protein [Lysobacter alkalisoli]